MGNGGSFRASGLPMSDFQDEDNGGEAATDAVGGDQRYILEEQTVYQPEKESDREDDIHEQGNVLRMSALNGF